MKARALFAACWLTAVLAGCTSGPGTEAPSVPVGGDGDGDGDGRDQDAASGEHEPDDGAHDDGGASDAGAVDDAGEPGPEAPTTDGVHLSVAGEPYETATDVFYFEAGPRPGIQADFEGASLRMELSRTLGTLRCGDGPSITYEVEGGTLRAGTEIGACTIELEAFGDNAGDPIAATLHARVERTSGEAADSLLLSARIQVAHP